MKAMLARPESPSDMTRDEFNGFCLPDDGLRDYIRQSHVIVSQGLSRKKRIELGLDGPHGR